MFKVGLAGLALLTLLALGCGSTPSSTASNESSPVPRADLSELESHFKTLMAADVVSGINGDHGTPWVMVGRSFYALTFEQKTAAAKQVSDYWAALKGGDPGSAVAFEFHDKYSGERLYEWNGFKLTQ